MSLFYFNYVEEKKSSMQIEQFQKEFSGMYSHIDQMIFEKQKSTTAIALIVSRDKNLIDDIKNKTIDKVYYQKLLQDLGKEKDYKHLWVHIIDKNLNSIYRSWTKKTGDNLQSVRSDLVQALKTKKSSQNISVGKFTISIKAIIPIVEKGKVIGIIEIISHFNSITQNLKKYGIDAIVALKREYSKQLRYPYSQNFINGYYIANLNPSKDKMRYLQTHNVDDYFQDGYKIENGYIITAYPLKNIDDEVLGYFIMFKDIDLLSNIDEELFLFKWVAIGFIVILIATGFVNILLFYILSRQKTYVKNIIDSSTNIVIVNDEKQIVEVNKTFFEYFTQEKTVEEFMEKYKCICELFIEEEGYIQKDMNDETWVKYVLNNNNKVHKVKLKYNGKIYYFTLFISLVSKAKHYYSAIFSDITLEENYKIELERLTITDTLTNIYNRRYYQTKIEETIALAKRYKFPFSIIMMDIDHFKLVNDEHGHGVGDSILVEYSKLIASKIRDTDIFCRIGGEEFIMIVSHTDRKSAIDFAQKLRKMVEEYKLILPITMSFGVTEYLQGEDSEHIFSRADQALYAAKENGRNQVVFK